MFNLSSIPNLPHLLGKGIGNALHAPIDLVVGVKDGFMGTKDNSKPDEHTRVEESGRVFEIDKNNVIR